MKAQLEEINLMSSYVGLVASWTTEKTGLLGVLRKCLDLGHVGYYSFSFSGMEESVNLEDKNPVSLALTSLRESLDGVECFLTKHGCELLPGKREHMQKVFWRRKEIFAEYCTETVYVVYSNPLMEFKSKHLPVLRQQLLGKI